eukprot:747411-Pyramimonas_sp.AAC.1
MSRCPGLPGVLGAGVLQRRHAANFNDFEAHPCPGESAESGSDGRVVTTPHPTSLCPRQVGLPPSEA